MICPIYALVTYGLFKLFGRKQTKYANHLMFWALFWIVSVVVSFSYQGV